MPGAHRNKRWFLQILVFSEKKYKPIVIELKQAGRQISRQDKFCYTWLRKNRIAEPDQMVKEAILAFGDGQKPKENP